MSELTDIRDTLDQALATIGDLQTAITDLQNSQGILSPDNQLQIDQLTQFMTDQQNNPFIPDHQHNGFDVSRVLFTNIAAKKFWVSWTLPGTSPATSGNYGTFFVAPVPCYVTGFWEVHKVAGTDGSAVTLQLEKLTGTTAPGSGNAILNAALSLKATINTVQTGVLTTTLSYLTLAIKDRLALKLSGTPTAIDTVTILTEIQVI